VHTDRITAVAVLMCVYGRDRPKLFERALASIEQQSWQGGELRIYVCVDGPVCAGIGTVLERHKDKIHRLTRNDSNIGLARSLNALLDSLEDEDFVFRMDSDDYAHADRITSQLATMHARPELDILGGSINEVDGSGTVLRTIRYPESAAGIRRLIPRRNPLAHPTICFRRRAVDRFVHYPDVPLSQDWALWFKCLSLGLVLANVRAVLVDMTVSEDFFRRRGPRRALDEFRILVRGIRSTHGLTWQYIYPVLRLLFRLMPQQVIKWAYASRLR
jgi:glycosyltransferase involved in cell wall biosynthesis